MTQPPELRRAQAFFRRLPREDQLALACELVETRGAELRLAYPDLVGIGFGFRTKRDAQGQRRLVRTPCVVFEVRRKRALSRPRDEARKLPSHLLMYVGAPGQRSLCAVPTDVRESAEFGKPVAHANLDLAAVVAGPTAQAEGAAGAIACAVRRSTASGLFALGCRHVLGRSLVESPEAAPPRRVTLAAIDGPVLGSTDRWHGELVPEPGLSFDAQIMRAHAGLALSDALEDVWFDPADPYVTAAKYMPPRFWVALPRRDAAGRRAKLRVDFIGCPERRAIRYKLPSGAIEAAHAVVIHGRLVEGLMTEGDSGSPALLDRQGTRLVGMYLGGDGSNVYFLPAWKLLDVRSYGLPASEVLSITNP